MKKSTGCWDVAGDEIFIGDILLVKSKLTERKVIVAVAEARGDDLSGFQVPYGNGYLRWDDDGTPCYEVIKLN